MTSAEARIAPRPRPFGRYSLRLAIWPVTAVVAAYVILLQVRDGTVVAEVVAAACLGHPVRCPRRQCGRSCPRRDGDVSIRGPQGHGRIRDHPEPHCDPVRGNGHVLRRAGDGQLPLRSLAAGRGIPHLALMAKRSAPVPTVRRGRPRPRCAAAAGRQAAADGAGRSRRPGSSARPRRRAHPHAGDAHARLAGVLGAARHRQDHGGAAPGATRPTCISSRFPRSSPASPTSRRCSMRRARGARPDRARCSSSTRSIASTGRSRTLSCR